MFFKGSVRENGVIQVVQLITLLKHPSSSQCQGRTTC